MFKACYHCISSHHSSLRLRAGPRWQATYCCSSETWGGVDLDGPDPRWFKKRTRVKHGALTSKIHGVSHGHWTRKKLVKHHGLTGSGFALLGCAPCHMGGCLHVSCWRSSYINWSQWNFARRTSQRCYHRYPSVIMTRTWLRWRLVLAWGVIDQVRCGQMTGLRLMMMVDDGYLGVHDG